ncbi:MAG: trigger factor [Cyclobacteriaceae bacterium]|nr:trigger factor [Cyclobacteriaceae bacterium]MCH8515538.1 trigger factor [Cyclobacteriaceae bacterium]
MDTSLEKKSELEAVLTVKLTEEDYKDRVQAKLKDYAKKANIKGFRPGKVPVGMIKNMYGTSVVMEEVNHLLTHAINDYIKDNKLNTVGEPLPVEESFEKINWDTDKDFEFSYELGLVSEFEANIDDSIAVEKLVIKIDDEHLNETIENLQNDMGETEVVEESQEGDTLKGDLEVSIDDDKLEKEIHIPIELLEGKTLIKKLVGISEGKKVSLKIKDLLKSEKVTPVSLGLTQEEADKFNEASASFTVKQVRRPKAAELNQEFFDRVIGKDKATTEEEFRTELRRLISENHDKEADKYFSYKVKEQLLQDIKIDTPDEFLKRWLKTTNDEKITDEVIEKEFHLFLKDMKWGIIRRKIADAHKIEVGHEEVVERTKELIGEYFSNSGMPADMLGGQMDQLVQNYLTAENGKNYQNTQAEVFNEKVLTEVKSKIKVNEKEVSPKEFSEEVSNLT